MQACPESGLVTAWFALYHREDAQWSDIIREGMPYMVADARTTPKQPDIVPRGVRGLLETPYAEYLNLDAVFDIQVAEHGAEELHHPEEVLFRTVHLASELWLRFAGYDVERVRDALDADDLITALRLARRVTMSIARVTEATGMLDTLAAADYHVFRVHFGGASGLQSPGYAYLRRECRALTSRLDTIVGDDDALFALYTSGRGDLRYDLCEVLLDLDASLDRFRTRHLQIAERFLGEMTEGTGGQGIGYLRQNIGSRLFPRLWALRGRIASDSGAIAYGYGASDSR
ncbi:MAG TPA: tryptophan 2,3-dioxygenase family protein [Thermomicrobiales bacterium]|nr:tryptophan 2,3-dioxygenase family protein [Thermomicrobiales bacterium]